jgi:hypothetical protein
MLKVESIGRLFFNVEARREKMTEAKLQRRRVSFKVVAAEVGRDLALGIENRGWVSVGTAPACRVVGSVGSFVPRSSSRRARIVSECRKVGERRKLWARVT